LTVTLLVDLSASEGLGTHYQTKRELITELGATLAFSAIKNNDNVGLHLFTDDIEKVVPASKGSRHVLRVIRELLYCEPIGRGTNLTRAIEHMNRSTKRRSVVFLISDFQDRGYERALRVAKRRHDVIPIVVADQREFAIPNMGLVEFRDAETGEVAWLDTSSRRHRQLYEAHAKKLSEERDRTLTKLGMDAIHVYTGEDFVDPLRKFFHRREKKR
jgi:uncharacterized protein (DUF58 family)